MDKNEMHYATITEVAAALRSREVTSVELTEWLLDRISRLDTDLNAYLTVTDSLALEQAYRADEELAEHIDRGPLHGVPVAVKDLIATRGIRTTGGSRLYEHWIPSEDANVVHQLYEAGAVLLGKTGLHELAFGSTSVNPFYGAIANPWRRDYHPGGSSGGSAVAVAAGMAYAAIGTDTGCSVRQPAECCGIVGHKPTFGLAGRSGVLPLIRSMDHVGPLARNVRDAAIVLQAIVGPDPGDSDSVNIAVPNLTEQLDWSIGGSVIGVPRGFFFEGGDREIVDIVDASLPVFEQLGATLIEISLPHVADAYQAADVTFVEIVDAYGEAMASSPSAFSEEFTHRFASVARSTAHEYAEAQKFRQGFRAEVAAIMEQCDILAMPTSTVAAAPIARQPAEHAIERRKNACIFNFTGQPAISVPCGFTALGLPVGLMLAGRMFEDNKVFQVASAFEQATPWHLRRPPIG